MSADDSVSTLYTNYSALPFEVAHFTRNLWSNCIKCTDAALIVIIHAMYSLSEWSFRMRFNSKRAIALHSPIHTRITNSTWAWQVDWRLKRNEKRIKKEFESDQTVLLSSMHASLFLFLLVVTSLDRKFCRQPKKQKTLVFSVANNF